MKNENEGKSVFAKRFIKNLKTKFTNIWLQNNNMFIFINYITEMQIKKCNNTYHSPIKIKPIHVKSSTYIDFDIGNKD